MQDPLARQLAELQDICSRLIEQGYIHWQNDERKRKQMRVDQYLGITRDEYDAWQIQAYPFHRGDG